MRLAVGTVRGHPQGFVTVEMNRQSKFGVHVAAHDSGISSRVTVGQGTSSAAVAKLFKFGVSWEREVSAMWKKMVIRWGVKDSLVLT